MTRSIKLTRQIRDGILSSVLAKFDENNPKPDFEKASNDLALYIWNKVHGKLKEQLEALPDGWLRTRNKVYFSVNGEVKFCTLEEALPSNQDSYSTAPLAILKDTDKQYNKMLKVKEATEAWKEERQALAREVTIVLDSVNTTKQLIEAWPAVEPFLPAHVADPSQGIQLPAIQTSRLNERLGLNK